MAPPPSRALLSRMIVPAMRVLQSAAAEGVPGDVDRQVAELREHADGTAAEVRAIPVAAVAEEPRVDRLELAALGVDGTAAVHSAVPASRGVGRAGGLVRAVEAVLERDVLHHDPRIPPIDAVVGRPLARTGVREQDP